MHKTTMVTILRTTKTMVTIVDGIPAGIAVFVSNIVFSMITTSCLLQRIFVSSTADYYADCAVPHLVLRIRLTSTLCKIT